MSEKDPLISPSSTPPNKSPTLAQRLSSFKFLGIPNVQSASSSVNPTPPTPGSVLSGPAGHIHFPHTTVSSSGASPLVPPPNMDMLRRRMTQFYFTHRDPNAHRNSAELGQVDRKASFQLVSVKELSQESSYLEAKVAAALILSYFAAVTLVFSYLSGSLNWPIVDSLYFGVVTLATVGYGDYTAKTDPQRLVVCLLVLFAVGCIATALGVVVGFVMDEEEKQRRAGVTDYNQEQRRKAVMSIVYLTAVLVIGTATFSYLESHTVITALYWCCVTLATVGYGDVVPKTTAGKWFSMVFIFFGTYFVARVLNGLVQIPLAIRRRRLHERVEGQFGKKLSVGKYNAAKEKVQELGLGRIGDNECVSKAEFTLLMLYSCCKFTEDDLNEAYGAFNSLDVNGDGVLNWKDILLAIGDKTDTTPVP